MSKIEVIVKILLDNQDGLSDGYGYYVPNQETDDDVAAFLEEIAEEIIARLEEAESKQE